MSPQHVRLLQGTVQCSTKTIAPGATIGIRYFATNSSGLSNRRYMIARDPDDEWHPRDVDNDGLYIKRTFKHTGHKHWGFIIYRCTYVDDAAWSRFMRILHRSIRDDLEYCGVPELMDSLDACVQQDQSVLDGASKDFVRQRFKQWRASDEAASERISADAQHILLKDRSFETGTTPRFSFCIHVDDAALRSIVDHDSDLPCTECYVNLIDAKWKVPSDEEIEELRQEHSIEDPTDEDEEPVDGCRMYDVGWMKVRVSLLMPGMYSRLLDDTWELDYVRPPKVYGLHHG